MISTRNGVDIISVTSLDEAKRTLSSLYEGSSLSKNEITSIVSFSGLSVADTVKCYNKFFREKGRYGDEISFPRAA